MCRQITSHEGNAEGCAVSLGQSALGNVQQSRESTKLVWQAAKVRCTPLSQLGTQRKGISLARQVCVGQHVEVPGVGLYLYQAGKVSGGCQWGGSR